MTTPWPLNAAVSAPPRRHCHYSLLTFLCEGRPKPKNGNKLSKIRVVRMTMAAAMQSRAGTRARPETSRIAGVELLGDMRAAETVWRGLEKTSQFFTPYQRFDFLAAWQRQVGEREGIRPFIVIAYDKDRAPLLLLPLGVKRESGVRVARFLGGKHATFNMALWRKDFASTATLADLDALISGIRAHGQADVLAL